ncbi:hypothetical protein V5F77_20605 [Xanthobacter sp. DSM 24535]|uniref:hypothetical protein n=1 Tax=Roseixanthobacter psychrophilus TaxID=3119917 RepID=UPI0037283D9C
MSFKGLALRFFELVHQPVHQKVHQPSLGFGRAKHKPFAALPTQDSVDSSESVFGPGAHMQYELISDEDYDTLPEDPEKKFVAIEQICRRNLYQLISNETPINFDNMLRLQYMTTISASAEELGIKGITFNRHTNDIAGNFENFSLDVSGVIARIRLRSSGTSDPNSVRLSARTRALIGREVERLREIIEKAEIPDAKRKALLKKLEELSEEIHKNRMAFGKALAIVAYVAAGCATGTSFLADAPGAIATITKLIGTDKAAEEAEADRLRGPAPQRALPAPKNEGASVSTPKAQRPPGNLDDEIPF